MEVQWEILKYFFTEVNNENFQTIRVCATYELVYVVHAHKSDANTHKPGFTLYKAYLFTATHPLFIFLGVGEGEKQDLLATLSRRQLEAHVMTLQFHLFH